MIGNQGLHDVSAVHDVAVAWVVTLVARGVTLRLRGKGQRLELVPGRAYGELSDGELLTLRHHREAIKEVVSERYAGTAQGSTVTPDCTSFVAPAEPVPPTPCPYCHQPPAACAATKTDWLEVWRTLHSLDPDEIARKNAEATAVMMMQVGKPPRW